MNINAEITGISYQITFSDNLSELTLGEDFDINNAPSCFKLFDKKVSYGVSKWVSPKRTRSYPFERVYNTLYLPKKITIIPIVKDEGARGDRDFLQWDTVSLMSLLDVYVILSYYNKADRHKTRDNSISNQQFDNNHILEKLDEISNYHSSALHWNLKEVNESLPTLIDKVANSYKEIQNKLNIQFHNSSGLERFRKQFVDGVTHFMNTSRTKAQGAQNREFLTLQPKEYLSTSTKAKITIRNYLGGIYYLTTDEIKVVGNKLHLIEGKHTVNSLLPSMGDIKDGLLKIILYCNLSNIQIDNKKYNVLPVLKLTSSKLIGNINLNSNASDLNKFLQMNSFSERQEYIVKSLFKEAKRNNFSVVIEGKKR